MPTLLLIRDRQLSQEEQQLLPDNWQVIDGAVPIVGRLDLRAPLRLVVEQAVLVARLLLDVDVVFHQQIPARIGQVRVLEASKSVDQNLSEDKRPASMAASTFSHSWWQLLEHGNIERARAVVSETAISPPEADEIERLLTGNDAAKLVFVIEVIARQQWSQFVFTLRGTLRHRSSAVRVASLQALQHMSAVQMLPYVELLLEDPNPDVAEIAARVLRAWARKN